MWFPRFVAVTALLVAPGAQLGARTVVGGFATWAVLCDGPRRCFAIAAPDGSDRRGYLTISFGRGAVQVHLGRPSREAALSVAGRRFALVPAGDVATANDATSRRIVAALGVGDTLAIAGVDARGRRFHQRYPLAGAPSAVAAAALAAMR